MRQVCYIRDAVPALNANEFQEASERENSKRSGIDQEQDRRSIHVEGPRGSRATRVEIHEWSEIQWNLNE